ncbi:MAG: malonyl-CoA decarboxylase [Acidobacteriota bacterium]
MATNLAEFFGFRSRPADEVRTAAPKTVQRAVSLCHSLLTERGEVSGARIALEIFSLYNVMDSGLRSNFFDALASEFSPNPEAVGSAGEAYRKAPSPKTLARLQRVVDPPRQELFRRLNMVPAATPMLVALRSEILKELPRKVEWEPIADDLGHLFVSWFNRGFLELRRIDWNSSAAVLEKLIQYEAVHAIQGFTDLRRRVAADRRCYAFFHPAMPDTPIIFVEIALSSGMSAKVQPLLDPDAPILDPAKADSAIFYSITNCHDGLRGVPFGSFLIKQVAEDLGQELPGLRRLATLSPVPGFAAWLKAQPCYASVAPILANRDWVADPKLSRELERVLVPLCAHYLLRAKKGSEPRDPVARFHLRNGSQLDRINWLADVSASGLKNSFGLMVNYVYRLSNIEYNHERYTQKYRVAASTAIEALANKADPTKELVSLPGPGRLESTAKYVDGPRLSGISSGPSSKPMQTVILPVASNGD